nr:hybrid signal transduction histidine kinase M [Tanacetum cinerariifolium]
MLSDKLMTVTNLTTLVPVKLDVDEMNYLSWAKLRSFKLGDLTIDAYFCKIESIATILTSIGSSISNDDVTTITLEGLPDKYDNVSGIIVHREPFLDLKTVHSMLTMDEMRLMSRDQVTSIDSTSPSTMVLLANSGTNTHRYV